MRRSVAILSLAALLVAALPGAVTAGAPTRLSGTSVGIECAVESEAGAFVSLIAASSEGFGSFAELALWAPGADPGAEPPIAFGFSDSVTGDAGGLEGTLDLVVEASGEPYGAASFEATFSPLGDPEPFEERSELGNRFERVSGTFQALAATGSLALPGGDAADLGGCFAAMSELTVFATNPAAFNIRQRNVEVGCTVEAADLAVFMSGTGFEEGGFVDVFVVVEGGPYFGGADGVVTTDSVEAAGTLESEGGGPAGSFSVSAVLAPTGEVLRFTELFPRGRSKVVQELYTVEGEIELTIGGTTTTLPLDASTCFAADSDISDHRVLPGGPKPGPLANDGPDGAIDVRLGRTIRVVTGGNDLPPEAPCTILAEDEEGNPAEFDVPFGYTAWYTVTGTGDEMTADTAGSLFDTVVGVYVDGAAGLEQVVCVDDIGEPDFSFQARATWASEAGTTYWIQVGGFDQQAGRLQLVVE